MPESPNVAALPSNPWDPLEAKKNAPQALECSMV
jgi:hypothetical protein